MYMYPVGGDYNNDAINLLNGTLGAENELINLRDLLRQHCRVLRPAN